MASRRDALSYGFNRAVSSLMEPIRTMDEIIYSASNPSKSPHQTRILTRRNVLAGVTMLGLAYIGYDFTRDGPVKNLIFPKNPINGKTSAISSIISSLTQSSSTQLYTVKGRIPYDYNGDGKQNGEEPPLQKAKVEIKDLSGKVVAEDTTDSSSDYHVDIPAGNYKHFIKPDDPKFRYMCRSVEEFRAINEGYDLTVVGDGSFDVGAMEGFLIWSFLKGTRYTRNDYLGRDSLFDQDPTKGVARAYDPSIPTVCSGSVCVADNHTGIDIGVNVGTHFVAAAPLTISRFSFAIGNDGKKVGKIFVNYINEYEGEYSHAQPLPDVKLNQKIPRGEEFGYVEESDIGASHLHYELHRNGYPIDPYADLLNKNSLSYWTVFNDPRYFN